MTSFQGPWADRGGSGIPETRGVRASRLQQWPVRTSLPCIPCVPRAQLGQHWHNELQKRTTEEFSVGGALSPDVRFEVVIAGTLIHRGWNFVLNGRIDQQ